MVDLLNDWAFVYYYRGRYKELLEKLTRYKELADSLDDNERLGMYQAWLGCALWHREMFPESHDYLQSALSHGEETRNNRLIGYACTWLTWVCTELGLLDEAMQHGKRAQIVSEQGRLDSYVYFNSLAGMGYNFWHRGEAAKTKEVGEALLKFGRDRSDNRIKGMGYCCIGWGHLAAGDLVAATPCFLKAVKVSVDPWYSVFPKLALSYGQILDGKIQDAEQHIKEISEFSQTCGAEFIGKPAHFFNGIAMIAGGQIQEGLLILEESIQNWAQNDSRLRFTACSFILANIYVQLAQKAEQSAQPALAPIATQKALSHFQATIDSAAEIGTNGTVGQAHLHLGSLYQAGGDIDQAGKHYSEAVKRFTDCDAGHYLQQAKQMLASLA
jgi:tetratricopeptide (TPR) repeat protein